MEQRLRIAAAAGVVLVGLLVALLFRHPATYPELPIPGTSDQLVLRKQTAPAGTAAELPGDRGAKSGPAATNAGEPRRVPTVLTPSDGVTPPPDLAKSYPGDGQQGTSRWGISMGQVLPDSNRPAAEPTHKIVDGDTLPALAQRYLGSADRAAEIFEANRESLSDPQLLPIGVELKIPPAEQRTGPSPDPGSQRALVPIARTLSGN